MARTHGTGRLRFVGGSGGVVPSLGWLSICVLLARPLREGLVGSCKTTKCRPRRRRGCCCEYGSPGLLYADARFREGAMPRARVGDAARSLVRRETSVLRGRVSRESAALYLWRAALLVRLALGHRLLSGGAARAGGPRRPGGPWCVSRRWRAGEAPATTDAASRTDCSPRATAWSTEKKKRISIDLSEEYN